MGCAPNGQFPVQNSSSAEVNESGMTSQWPGDEKIDPHTLEAMDYKMIPLAWESKRYPERALWSLYLQFQIVTNWRSLLTGAEDMISFCPKYDSLNDNQKANVWAQLFVGVSKHESDWNPRKRYLEETMGIDPVTQAQVQSEGLLQLSYQDAGWAKYCRFDWEADKDLAVTDRSRTIFNPYRNLNCGLGLMARQIKKKGRIIVGEGAYWSTIRSDGKFQHIAEIADLVSKLPICK
jgi:Transglycosylase SLT domain.